MTPPVRLDLHVHSNWSADGRSSVAEHAASAAAAGLGGFALTDHNSVRGHAQLLGLRSQYPSLLLVPGVEVSTREGHLLAYGVAQAPPPGRPLAETLEWVRARGGEGVIAHPFRWPHGAARHLRPEQLASALETVNAHNSARANRRADALAADGSRARTGGSDAHTHLEVGRAVTVVPDDCTTVDDVLEAIRTARTTADGRALSASGWLGWAVRAGVYRLGRGLRSV